MKFLLVFFVSLASASQQFRSPTSHIRDYTPVPFVGIKSEPLQMSPVLLVTLSHHNCAALCVFCSTYPCQPKCAEHSVGDRKQYVFYCLRVMSAFANCKPPDVICVIKLFSIKLGAAYYISGRNNKCIQNFTW